MDNKDQEPVLRTSRVREPEREPDREMDTRATQQRPTSWQPATLLPEPVKEPGYEYRWIRVSIHGKEDPRNMSGKLREGWEPVRIEEQPQFKMLVDPSSRFKDNIEVSGLLLCKIPASFMAQRKAHFEKLTRAQTEAVDNNFMKENDPRMPLFRERKSSSSFGTGR